MNILIAHPVLAAAIVALVANLFVAGIAYGLSGKAGQHRAALVALWRRLFTDAGSTCHHCQRWSVSAFCPTCEQLRVLTPTRTESLPEIERVRLRGIWQMERESSLPTPEQLARAKAIHQFERSTLRPVKVRREAVN